MELELSLEFLHGMEEAAIAAARTMEEGNVQKSDEMAVEAMRRSLDQVPIQGTVVIGESDRDKAPMLFIGEKVGSGNQEMGSLPEVDIAVDPLEGTNLCATGAANSTAVLAASEKGELLNAPDCYMEKIIVGPTCKGVVDLDAPVKENLGGIARRRDRSGSSLPNPRKV